MKFSDDAKLTAAAAIYAQLSFNKANEAWLYLNRLTNAAPAPAGDTAQTVEPTEEVRPAASQRPCPTDLEWMDAIVRALPTTSYKTTDDFCRAVSDEAHHLAALRGKA